MSALMDILNRKMTHDHVDNPYFSVFQIRVRHLLHNNYIKHNFQALKKKEEERNRSKDLRKWKEIELNDKTAEEKDEVLLNTL